MKRTTLNRMMAFASVLVLSGALANTVSVVYAQDNVATVGDQTITKEDLYNQMKKDAGLVTLRSMILQKVLEMNAPNAADIKKKAEEEVAKQIEKVGGEEKFQELLTYQKLGSVEDFKNQIYIRNLFNEVVSKQIDQSDATIEDYYNNTYQPKMEAQHILVDTEEEAKDIISKLDAGENFDELAKTYSKDGSAQQGGLLSPFTSGQMVKEFEDGVKGQANGEYTKTPVKSKFGYHIIKTINNGEKKPLADIKDDVKKEYLDSKIKDQKFSYKIIGKLIEAAKVQIDDADLKDAVKELVDLANQPDDVSSQDAPSTTPDASSESSSN